MDEKSLNAFLEKFMANQVSDPEHQEFVDELSSLPEEEVKAILSRCSIFFQQHSHSLVSQYDELIEGIEETLNEADAQEAGDILRPWYRTGYFSAAAVALICAMLFLYFKPSAPAKQQPELAKKYNEILPGGNKAVLTLEDGSRINLSDAANGELVRQKGFSVQKVKAGELVYRKKKENLFKTSDLKYNALVTPKGGQYKITLDDGTRVWLNAASTLKFPAVFKGRERRIELSGEAYFEVAKKKSMPFIVNVNGTAIKVLGTHFNVMGYHDEPAMRTTLLEGAVRIIRGSDQKDIIPGQQAVVSGQISIRSVDTSQVVGWKNGDFTFDHEKIGVVMKKISRWYNVDIRYQGKVTAEEFVGKIPRSRALADVLHKLELTGLLKFKLKERSVIVMN